MTCVCVIGAGLGGLALAIRLQSSGIETTLIEAHGEPGGQWRSLTRDGFTFDSGPAALADPVALAELWQLAGGDMAEHIELMSLELLHRFNWPDGTVLDVAGGDGGAAAMRREVGRIAPDDAAGYEEFLRWSDQALRECGASWQLAARRDLGALLRSAPMLARHQAWRSAYGIAARFIKSERLREAISVSALAEGTDPFGNTAFQTLAHKRELDRGLVWPKGGFGKLAAAMATRFEQLGGIVVSHDPVLHIHTLGDRASEVECVSGWRQRFDAVASCADMMHTYRDLLCSNNRGPVMARQLVRRRFSPSKFSVHFGLEGSWPGIPHNTVLLAQRFKGLTQDIFDHGLLPRDFIVFLQHPSVTDPSLAPPGKSTFRATIVVANQAQLPIDWDQAGPQLERRILDEIGRRLIPDLDDRLVTKFHVSPRDLAHDLNMWVGSAGGFAATRTQSLWPPVGERDATLSNLYFAGVGTRPGGGVAGVLTSARTAAKRILEEVR
jgi:phytoene desaturase